jgi:hypothetical protein
LIQISPIQIEAADAVVRAGIGKSPEQNVIGAATTIRTQIAAKLKSVNKPSR